MRVHLQEMLIRIHSHYNLTSILVSHDMREIVKLTSKTIHLVNGTVTEFQSPDEIFLINSHEPSSLKVIFLSSEKKEKEFKILVLAGNQVITINCHADDAKDLQKGDEVLVSFKGATAFLCKL